MSIAERQAAATTLRPGNPEDVGMSAEQLRRVGELARGWVDEDLLQGLVGLVARHGRIVFYERFGRQLPDRDSPSVSLDSIFPMASITKIFTTTAVMLLVEEGRVGLNRRVREYIPEFAGEGKDGVLLRHLLTHTSGIGEDQLEAFAKEREGIAIPPADATLHPLMNEYMVQRYDCPLSKPPGAEMSYADFNFELAGEIVRRVTGKSLADFARLRIFEPLGMPDTHYCRVDVPRQRRAWRGPDPEDPWREAIEIEPIAQASGRSWASAMDMAIFCQMFLNRGTYGDVRILSPASVVEMTRNQIPGVRSTFLNEVFPEASWGLGWSIHGTKTGLCGTLYSPEAFEHWGAGGAYVWADPLHDLVGIYCAVAPNPHSDEGKAKWRNGSFTDAVTAAVIEV
ncbi:MAG TPA: serine hydrolase domain-containing protein [Candidatus Dormibacteraeota bacterium]|jgi:CubicO group peptidase (beta-lactamase class C family)|nr:serine hydrolase domain-containing protein [Candidatus Dormibacteraeota bacterium]